MTKEKANQEGTQRERNQPAGRSQGERQKGIQTSGREREKVRGLSRREPFPEMWGFGPLSLMGSLADEMERLFENFGLSRAQLLPLGRRELRAKGAGETGIGFWSPEIEVLEREGQLVVRADLPGLKREDIRINITDDALVIEGERRQESEEEKEGYYRSERSYGSFYRNIPLPQGVETENAAASFQDGVLEITIPAPERVQRRRQIEIGEGTAGEEKSRARAKTTSR
jgi:HSP20 family protein